MCIGTKEMEECYCRGDVTKCDFYPDKRKVVNKCDILESINNTIKNGFEFSISRDREFKDYICFSVKDPKTMVTINNTIKCANNTFSDYGTVMAEMIESMVDKLKGDQNEN